MSTAAASPAPAVKKPRSRKPPELADLALWFGADRWSALEKQAAIARAWDGNKFRNEAAAMLEGCLKGYAPALALHVAAMALLIALGSAPTEADRARRPCS